MHHAILCQNALNPSLLYLMLSTVNVSHFSDFPLDCLLPVPKETDR